MWRNHHSKSRYSLVNRNISEILSGIYRWPSSALWLSCLSFDALKLTIEHILLLLFVLVFSILSTCLQTIFVTFEKIFTENPVCKFLISPISDDFAYFRIYWASIRSITLSMWIYARNQQRTKCLIHIKFLLTKNRRRRNINDNFHVDLCNCSKRRNFCAFKSLRKCWKLDYKNSTMNWREQNIPAFDYSMQEERKQKRTTHAQSIRLRCM